MRKWVPEAEDDLAYRFNRILLQFTVKKDSKKEMALNDTND
jgi:hypothetical protein